MDARLIVSPPLTHSPHRLSHACLRLRAAYRLAFLAVPLARFTGEARP